METTGQRRTLDRPLDELDDAALSIGPYGRGMMLGRYIVLGLIGQGGMGVVYSGYDPELQREVAIKLLRADRAKRSTAAEVRLRREAQAMARISHPNVLPVYDVGVVDSRVFVAMEYVQARTLSEWIDEETPGWATVLDKFIDAGRGLAAAHAVGLIHRDFKPHNVLIGPDGRPRVMDFGLARAKGPDTGSFEDEPTLTCGDTLDTPLTATGSVVGTPRYMAPEQHKGWPTDARCDQFAFAAALYEALLGVRPFGSGSVRALGRRKLRGDLAPPRDDAAAPAWVRRVIVRALSPDPADRWSSMDVMLSELRRRPPRRRRWALAAVGAGLMVSTAAGAVVAAQSHDADPCQGATPKADAVWSADRAAAVRSGLTSVGHDYAESVAVRVQTRVDDYVEEWVDAHVGACEATAVREEQSPELLDRRVACLDRQLGQLDALLSVFEAADDAVLSRAALAVDRLPSPTLCDDPIALFERPPPPTDPSARSRLEAAQTKLARGRALTDSAQYDDAVETLRAASVAAKEIGYDPFTAEVQAALASATVASGDVQRGRELATEALNIAVASRAGGLAANIATSLVFLEGYELNNPAEAHRWARLAEAFMDGHGGSPQLRIALINSEAIAYVLDGKFDRAQSSFDRALALQRTQDPQSSRLAVLAGNAGTLLAQTGEYKAARRYLEEAIAHHREHVGLGHPQTSKWMANLAALEVFEGDYETAEPHLRQVLRKQEALLGRDHPDVASTLNNLANTVRAQGNNAEAIALHRRALRIRTTSIGRRSLPVAQSLDNLAIALLADGDLDVAKDAADRALEIRRGAVDEGHPALAASHLTLGQINREAEQFEEAAAHFAKALAMLESTHGEDHPRVLAAVVGLGLVYEKLGNYDAARVHLERAAALGTARTVEPVALAQARFGLARVLERTAGSKGRGRTLARLARETFVRYPGGGNERLEAVDAWLEDRRG